MIYKGKIVVIVGNVELWISETKGVNLRLRQDLKATASIQMVRIIM